MSESTTTPRFMACFCIFLVWVQNYFLFLVLSFSRCWHFHSLMCLTHLFCRCNVELRVIHICVVGNMIFLTLHIRFNSAVIGRSTYWETQFHSLTGQVPGFAADLVLSVPFSKD